jgi:hypothetical protein
VCKEIYSSCGAFLHQVVDALFLLAIGIALGLLCGCLRANEAIFLSSIEK